MISVTRDFYALRIHFGDVLHVYLKMEELLGIQAWLKPKPSIEYVLRGGNITTEYDDREKWTVILSELEKVL